MTNDPQGKPLDNGPQAETPARLLLVDDIPQMLTSMAQFLLAQGYQVDTAVDGVQAMRMLAARPYHLVVTEVNLARTNFLEWVRTVRQLYPDTLMLVMTQYANMARAVEALEMGAFEYLVKPIIDDELQATIQTALHQQNLLSQNHPPRRPPCPPLTLENSDRWRPRRQTASLRKPPPK